MLSITHTTQRRPRLIPSVQEVFIITTTLFITFLPTRAVEDELFRYIDIRRPLEEREADIAVLSERGDEQAVYTLMALGSSDAYVKVRAIESLGDIGYREKYPLAQRNELTEVSMYLRRKAFHPEPGIACAAVKSLVRLEGKRALDDVQQFLQRNRERTDGFHSVVLPAGIQAVAEINDPHSVELLEQEIEEVVKPEKRFEYGSDIVEALAKLNRPEGYSILMRYASWLQSQMSTVHHTQREYLREKQKEALSAAETIDGNGQQLTTTRKN